MKYSIENLKSVKGKILNEVVENWDGDEDFFIGARSAFFFIGNKSEYPDGIKEANEYYLSLYRDEYKEITDFFEETVYKPMKPRKDETMTKYAARLRMLANRIENESKEVIEIYKRWHTHVNLQDRKIVDAYLKIQPSEPGVVFIVEGKDSGRFWLKEEYLHRNDKEHKEEEQDG